MVAETGIVLGVVYGVDVVEKVIMVKNNGLGYVVFVDGVGLLRNYSGDLEFFERKRLALKFIAGKDVDGFRLVRRECFHLNKSFRDGLCRRVSPFGSVSGSLGLVEKF